MAEQSEDIIIDIQIDPETPTRLTEVTNALRDLKSEEQSIKKEIKETGTATNEQTKRLAELEKQSKSLQAEQKMLTGQLQTQTQVTNQLGDSYVEMNARLAQLQKEYKSLGKAQRESAEGQSLLKAIQIQKNELKALDETLGDHQRNVGNYAQALAGVIPGMNKLQGAVQSLGKVFVTPPVAVIAAVVGAMVWAFQKLREAFQRNDDASTKLQAAFAKLQPIGDAIGIMFNKLADIVAGLVDKMMKAYEWVIKFGNRLHIVSDDFVQATEAAANLVRSVDELEQMEREYTVNSAIRSKEVAKLRNEAMSTDDLQERMRMLKKAIDLETETLAEAQAIARKRVANLEAEADKTGDKSDETANKIAQARAAMYRAEEAYYTGTRRLLKELQSVEKEYIQEVTDKEELDAFVQDTLQKFMTAKQAVEELRKPEPIEKEEIEEYIRPLTAYEEEIARLMDQGYTFADAQKVIANQTKAAWADAASGILGGMGQAFGAMSDLLKAYEEENKEAAKAAKAFALVSIIASEAESIANGVKAMTTAIATATAAAAATGPAAIFTTPGFIAEMTAIVGGVLATTMANITQAKNILSSAKFATGGIVGGNSYSGDRVPAMVNSGEMILNRDQQQRLFEIANAQTAGGQYEMMQAAMTEALRAMPAPVLEYSEFRQFNKRVATYKEIASV